MPISHGHNRIEYGDYVPELEADELISAVKLKQNMYDEGRAKVQEFYDQMSTLPLVRDVDKQYMNDQLNQIFDVIEKNAGNADFSNPQTVRSFMKIADPLKKDPILKNALDASQEYQTRLQTLEDVKTKSPDKYSPANEWDYLNDLEDWMNGATPGQKLQKKSYLPYTDNSKHYAELIKGLQAQVETEFKTMSSSGLINNEEIKSLKQNRIKELLMQSMTPSMHAQMDIDSRYHTSSLSNEEKYNKVVSIYQSIADRNKTLSKIRGIENETGMTNEEYAMEAQAADEILASLVDPNTGEIRRDQLDALYSNAYISDWAEGLGKTYAYKQVKANLSQNFLQMQRVRDNAALKRLEKKAELDYQNARKLKQEFPDAKSADDPKAPQLFKDKQTNAAYLEKLKSGKVSEIKIGANGFNERLTDDTKARIMSNLEVNKLVSMKDNGEFDKPIVDFRMGMDKGKILYKVQLKGDPVLHIISEEALSAEVDAYVNGSTTETTATSENPVAENNYINIFEEKDPNQLNADQIAALQMLDID